MKKHRAFLKWAGGKYSLVDDIRKYLPESDVLIEPFVGAGSVFLNTDYQQYRLSDINPDLINLYNHLKQNPVKYITDSKYFFCDERNQKQAYLGIRSDFNRTEDSYLRSIYFLYLNRYGFNGLCRYNKKGDFNVPFGTHKRPYFPEAELVFFAEKAQKATFICESYEEAFQAAKTGDVMYCDPPYAPLPNVSVVNAFASYASNGFSLDDQDLLAKKAKSTAQEKNISVLISNHDTQLTRQLYREATELNVVKVQRSISRNGGNRKKVNELLALFTGEEQNTEQQTELSVEIRF